MGDDGYYIFSDLPLGHKEDFWSLDKHYWSPGQCKFTPPPFADKRSWDNFLLLYSFAVYIVEIFATYSFAYSTPPLQLSTKEYSNCRIFFIGTQHGRETDDPFYYTTNSNVPHLPFVTGYMGTHGTYRFMTVSEQTLVVIGDGKLLIKKTL